MKCPYCNSLINADTEMYVRPGKSVHEGAEIIGCENCIRTTWGDEFFDEGELLDLEDRKDQALWDDRKDRRIERMLTDV